MVDDGDLDEAERTEAGLRLAKMFPRDIERALRELNKVGVTTTGLEVAKLWFEFSMWWCAEWLYFPRSNTELRHILLRGLRKEARSEQDWRMKCLEEYYTLAGNCWPLPVRWDVSTEEFDAAARRLLGGYWEGLPRHIACDLVARGSMMGTLKHGPNFDEDFAKIQIVASAYWFTTGRKSPGGYPR